MTTTSTAKQMKSYIDKLINLFLSRNLEYASEEVWYSNFKRNAELCRVLRIKEILEQPYGQSLRYAVDKIDRVINGILQQKRGHQVAHIEDSIDDAIVYLIITKYILIEEGLM